ncbi:hypothetical protein F511_45095 [Dorcoceras hygrometricum]|uniref:Uncharacterized protein n=1 Tax=Dorcoceras hygrometricum TaxID=472368 RepID=A0A2Z7A472_9LAMI|nr:hypothetical protein F511_45095 [Dorcoceras hygrometricum]
MGCSGQARTQPRRKIQPSQNSAGDRRRKAVRTSAGHHALDCTDSARTWQPTCSIQRPITVDSLRNNLRKEQRITVCRSWHMHRPSASNKRNNLRNQWPAQSRNPCVKNSNSRPAFSRLARNGGGRRTRRRPRFNFFFDCLIDFKSEKEIRYNYGNNCIEGSEPEL